MADFEIRPVAELAPAQVADFLRRMFDPVKGAFLADWGRWWHGGDENRFGVLAEDGALAAYFAITPMQCVLGGEVRDSLWWIDLIVDPAFRRRGLQTVMDDAVRTRPGLKLGFPNEFHSTILARHGWGVRGDLRKQMLPLRLHRVRFVQQATGWRGRLLRLGATLTRPGLAGLRAWWGRYRPRYTQAWPEATPAALAAIFAQAQAGLAQTEGNPAGGVMTTQRSAPFFQWRYFDCPYREELRFYRAQLADGRAGYAIARFSDLRGLKSVRILDLYGDFARQGLLRDLLATIRRDAVQAGADQVIILSSLSSRPGLRAALRAGGFSISVPVYFCWHAQDPVLHRQLHQQPLYWTLADSDNDEPH